MVNLFFFLTFFSFLNSKIDNSKIKEKQVPEDWNEYFLPGKFWQRLNCFHKSHKNLGWKRPSRSSSCNSPAMGRDMFHSRRLLRSPSNLALNTDRDWALWLFLSWREQSREILQTVLQRQSHKMSVMALSTLTTDKSWMHKNLFADHISERN